MIDFIASVAAILLMVVWVVRHDQKRAARKDSEIERTRHRERVLKLVNERREPRWHHWQ
jgi:hypothetical protein